MKFFYILVIAAVAITLSGCGGGGGGGSIVDPPTDVTGPTFKSCTAVYNYPTADATITASVTDASGVLSVRAYVNGGGIGSDLLLTSANTYTGIHPNVPDNTGDTDITYTVIVFATDTKGNVTTSQTTFVVPSSLLPPPPPPMQS